MRHRITCAEPAFELACVTEKGRSYFDSEPAFELACVTEKGRSYFDSQKQQLLETILFF
jgi:hypothetical protein